MCSHPDHQVEVLPDGQVYESHTVTDEHMADLLRAIDLMAWRTHLAFISNAYPQEEVPDATPFSRPLRLRDAAPRRRDPCRGAWRYT